MGVNIAREKGVAVGRDLTQTLHDWVHRYNAEGLAGLISRVGLGPAPLSSEAQMAELLALVVNGPDPEVDRSCVGAVSICKSKLRADFR